MDINQRYIDLNDEISALKNKVFNLINNAHMLSIGEWKESILREILSKQLPNIGIGTGFVVAENKCSTQIDIIIYDKSGMILFENGNFVIVTPNKVLCLIEVKSKQDTTEFKKAIETLSNAKELVESSCKNKIFAGLFIYEKGKLSTKNLLSYVQKHTKSEKKTISKLHNSRRRPFY